MEYLSGKGKLVLMEDVVACNQEKKQLRREKLIEWDNKPGGIQKRDLKLGSECD